MNPFKSIEVRYRHKGWLVEVAHDDIGLNVRIFHPCGACHSALGLIDMDQALDWIDHIIT